MPTPDRRTKQMFALLHQGGVQDRDKRLALMSAIVHRDITTTNDLTVIETLAVVDILDYWKRLGELPERCTSMIGDGDA